MDLMLLSRSQAGEKEARERLVEKNLGLVHHIVKRFLGRGCDPEDLFQIGTIGLLKAIDKFDVSFEVQFSTYAVPMIQGEIKRFLRDDGMIKISRSVKENAWKINHAATKIAQEQGREATLEEVARETGLAPEEVVIAMDAGREVESIYRSVSQTAEQEQLLIDKLPEPRDIQTELMNRLLVEQLMQELSDREQELIRLRYFEMMTQMQVADRLQISQVQVSRLEKKILLRMREKMN